MFFGHCQRTRFRDSFCLASVFEMTVLLTYLLTYCIDILTCVYPRARLLATLQHCGEAVVRHDEMADPLKSFLRM